MTKQKIRVNVATTPWWIRLAIYVVVAGVGLVLTLLGIVEPATVDGWLGNVGGLAAFVGGLVAALFTGRHSDEAVQELPAMPALAPVTTDTGLPVHDLPTSTGDYYAD